MITEPKKHEEIMVNYNNATQERICEENNNEGNTVCWSERNDNNDKTFYHDLRNKNWIEVKFVKGEETTEKDFKILKEEITDAFEKTLVQNRDDNAKINPENFPFPVWIQYMPVLKEEDVEKKIETLSTEKTLENIIEIFEVLLEQTKKFRDFLGASSSYYDPYTDEWVKVNKTIKKAEVVYDEFLKI